MRFKTFTRFQIAAVLVGALSLGSLTTMLAQKAIRSATGNAPLSVRVAAPGLPPGGFADVVSHDLPAVVSIATTRVVKTSAQDSPMMDPFFRRFFGDEGDMPRMPRSQKERAAGSGVIVSPDGYIVTNNHVVDHSNQITVTLSDKREFKARLIGNDARTDIAVLKIDATGLPTVAFADSAKVRVGDYAIAIGNPFNIGQTVTFGIVSATGRGNLGIEDYEDFIQTDAAINPGNSGGALVNSKGDLIGINTAIISPNGGGNNGVGFAVPANMARRVMEDLVDKGKVSRGYLGVTLQSLNPALSSALGVKDTRGALVSDVKPDSPAAKAGLQSGDIITAYDGQPVMDSNQLKNQVGTAQPGQVAHLNVLRSGASKQLDVTLGEMPNNLSASLNEPGSGENSHHLGLELGNLDQQTLRQLELPRTTQGVVVLNVEQGSPAADAGLQRGDVIQQVNRKPVTTVNQAADALHGATGKSILLSVLRDGTTLFVAIQPAS